MFLSVWIILQLHVMSFFGQIQFAFVLFLFYFLTRETTQSESKYYFF